MSANNEPAAESHRFLTPERIARVAELIEPLLRDGMSWIERRKESVVILDDTALRRQISVDFTLRSTTPALVEAPKEGDEAIYCAPVFALPKAPSNLMAFDLQDEAGRSLRLVSRNDNAQISGKALRKMAKRVLGHEPDAALGDELELIAAAGADEGEQRAMRLEKQPAKSYAAEAAKLIEDDRFRWLLSTFAHSSILVVLFRSVSPRRKLIKLTFEQPIESELRARASLGWDHLPRLGGLPPHRGPDLPLRGRGPSRAADHRSASQRRRAPGTSSTTGSCGGSTCTERTPRAPGRAPRR